MNKITLLFIAACIAFWLLSNPGPGAAVDVQNVSCVESYHMRYGGQWSEMNQAQRLAVFFRAASCEEGR